jgi:serine/threonine-protein kinase
VAQTVAAPPEAERSHRVAREGLPASLTSTSRSTVLPRVEGDGIRVRLIPHSANRYEPIKLLGEGGMGEVMLVRDQDIARPVAVKRLRLEGADPSIIARFVDEIRTVGRLEHPNIVPIHDVGVDEQGRYFFVMKYVEGETLESIIQKLAAGDPDYHARYSFQSRVEIFIGILHALAYAHEHGVVHRDVKPANVMVGRFGEVMLMDWGIAKPIGAGRDLAAGANATLGDEGAEPRSRMYATRVGSLVGTPAYMAPEQARGENDRVSAQSDLYSACAVFFELLTLRHYIDPKPTTDALLAAVTDEEITFAKIMARNPHQERAPVELLHFTRHGLEKDPARRHTSASAMIDALQWVLEGRFHVHCHITLAKRVLRETARLLDRRPRATFFALLGVIAAVIFAGVQLVRIVIT